MYLIVTRTFPPELGGMQNLMWGLARSLSKLNLIKVFADYQENHEEFDKSVSFSIERVGGIKLIRKYRKSYMINDYLEQNNKVQCI
ncbi:glycosyl transferase, partial [Pelagibacteraceae bacterium GOM-A3]